MGDFIKKYKIFPTHGISIPKLIQVFIDRQ